MPQRLRDGSYHPWRLVDCWRFCCLDALLGSFFRLYYRSDNSIVGSRFAGSVGGSCGVVFGRHSCRTGGFLHGVSLIVRWGSHGLPG